MEHNDENNNMSISEATSTLISKILTLPPQDILELLNEVEERSNENRREKRINYSSEVVFSVNKRFHKGYIDNINSNGLFIQTTETFRKGQRITLSFEIPSLNEHIKISGSIVRIAPDGFGVTFDVNVEDLLEQKRRKDSDDQQPFIYESGRA